ncbi:MAG: sensor histidine kinase N-terminal domain-containing protein [Betaproteobacteria bacterium]
MTHSLQRYLLVGILCPVMAFMLLNAFSVYQQALQAADTAYDRTLLASAKAIGELLEVVEDQGQPRLRSPLPYSALEAFEADMRSRMYFRVSGFSQEMVSGYEDLPPPRAVAGSSGPYAALVDFYDATYRDEPVRMAVLLQPVSGVAGRGMATVQVAETLELRKALAGEVLLDMAWKQGVLIALIGGVVVLVVKRGTRPLRRLSQQWQSRAEDDLSALSADRSPKELWPVVEAANAVMARLDRLLRQQKRFVRDASHQLRTPLTVLKVQVQSARRGDLDPLSALQDIESTVDGATALANQMLALAKAEQLRQQEVVAPVDWAQTLRAVALELAPLMADRHLDLDLHATACEVRAHEWGLRELTRNLLHNAIRHSPEGGRLLVQLEATGAQAVMRVCDEGPGISANLRSVLFQPFARGDVPVTGSCGLGLAICREITMASGGRIQLDNRAIGELVVGLDAVVTLPTARIT